MSFRVDFELYLVPSLMWCPKLFRNPDCRIANCVCMYEYYFYELYTNLGQFIQCNFLCPLIHLWIIFDWSNNFLRNSRSLCIIIYHFEQKSITISKLFYCSSTKIFLSSKLISCFQLLKLKKLRGKKIKRLKQFIDFTFVPWIPFNPNWYL